MSREVLVTGLGMITAIGNNVDENYLALCSGKSGLSPVELLPGSSDSQTLVGEVKLSNSELKRGLKLAPTAKITRSSLLGIWAAQEAVANAGLSNLGTGDTGFISGTTVGGMDRTEEYFLGSQGKNLTSTYINTHSLDSVSQIIASTVGIRGFTTTISTACSSSANAIMLGARLISAGKLQKAVVGGTDCLTRFTLNGFNSLMLLSESACTPFDANRKGLNLGEAAAYMVLEAAGDTTHRKKALAQITGFANTNDAYHQTASTPDGDGAYLAMKKALSMAKIDATDIGYVNAHGTATVNNDLSEGRALQRIFGTKIPAFSSTKPFTGHTLGAAGAVEAAYSVLALNKKQIFPNLNFKTSIPGLSISPITQLAEADPRHAMSNSFGFGGNCTVLIFSR